MIKVKVVARCGKGDDNALKALDLYFESDIMEVQDDFCEMDGMDKLVGNLRKKYDIPDSATYTLEKL